MEVSIHPMDEFCGSKFWDSNLTWFTVDPDFTKCFEETVLVWAPCAFFWTLALVDVYYLKASLDKNIPWNKLNISKLILTAGLLILTALDLIMALIKQGSDDTSYLIHPVDIWTPVIKFATFLLLFLFIPLNRKYGVQTSGCQFMFWFFLVIFSIPRCRTEAHEKRERNRILNDAGVVDKLDYAWADYKYVSFMIYFALSCAMLLLNCFADAKPSSTKYERAENEVPECSASFLSRITYTWFDKMAWKGYRKPLEVDDLWSLRPQDSCKEIVPLFAHYWNKHVRRNNRVESTSTKAQYSNDKVRVSFDNPQNGKNEHKQFTASIVSPIVKSFAGIFLFGSLMRLVTDVLMFAQPQVLRLIIDFTEQRGDAESESPPQWRGIFYAFLLFSIAIAQTLFMCQYYQSIINLAMRIRSAIIVAIYRKALVISNTARKESTMGEIVNLMAVDTQTVVDFITYANVLWSAPLRIVLALYFLWQLLGPSVLVGAVFLILMIPLNGFIANRMKTYQTRQMRYKDERIKLMNELLSGIKVLKLYAWEPSFEDQVLQIRDKEIATLKSLTYLNATSSCLWFCASVLVSLITFATYVLIDENNVLNATKIFVSLSLFNLLRYPLIALPTLITNLIQSQVAAKRINKFMNSEELDPNSVQHDPNEKHPMIIENGTFSWGDEQITLKNINIQVPKGTLCAIVGTVGAGKSSVIQAFLGEMEKLSGRVNTVGSMAYVSQQAWIQNATLRDNILFGKPYERKFYNRVIDACALRADIDILSAGDLTEIGEKGINLSGGQKQRVSLARALYSKADLYLFDDPLSAVDSHVGKHIFEEVIGPNGILASKTRVLVTHGITFLPQTDNIYVVKAGEISESGSYQELLNRRGAFADFLIQHLQEGSEQLEDLNMIKQQLENAVDSNEIIRTFERAISLAQSENLTEAVSISSMEGKDSLRRRKVDRLESQTSALSNVSDKPKAVPKEGKLIEAEKAAKGSVHFDVYKYYIKNIGIFLSVATLMLYIVFEVFLIGSNLWLTKWSTDKRVENDTGLRDMYLGVYAVFGFAQAGISFLMKLAPAFGALRASKLLHRLLLSNILRTPMSFFDTTPLGRILSRFSKDVEMTDQKLAAIINECLWYIFEVLATVVVISLSTPIFLTLVVPIAILYYLAQRYFVPTSRQLMRLESISRSPIYSHFSETITGISTIRAYTVQDRFNDELDEKVDRFVICKYPLLIANRWLAVRLEMLGNFIILFASLFTVLGGQSNPGLVGLSVSYALQVTQNLSWLVRMTSNLETNIVAVERIKEYGEIRQEAAWDIENTRVPRNWPLEGCVVFDNFKVRYREGLDLVLHGISFSIQGGEKVGIVGRTGAGKSSLTLSLFRIIEAAGGRILIDGFDIATLGLHMLRSCLTIIPQDPVLFSGSLRMNLDPFEVKSDDELWQALELSHLRAFVKTLPAGLNHKISEGGENLSMGQRQLICLARALLRKTKVLVLDEATAAVDLATDDLIQKTIRTEFKDCTVLTIAHRLNTIMDSDKVIVLDKGEITEFAAPAQLLENHKSAFYNMAKDANLV